MLQRRDNEAFRYLYDCYYKALSSLANYFVKDQLIADDLVQEVFIAILQGKQNFSTISEIKYFLYTSVKNRCLSCLRNQKVHKRYHQEVLSSETEIDEFWEKALEEDVYVTLILAIRQLPLQCQTVMLLTLEGLKVKDIAVRMQISEKMVKMHRKNGKEKLLMRFRNSGIQILLFFLFDR